MGLDAVEIIMEAEEEFGIEILDDDYSSLITVGDFHQMIVQKLKTNNELLAAHQPCPSIPAFLETRKAFCSLTNIKRNKHRPFVNLQNFLPVFSRRAIWRTFQSTTKIELPKLVLHEPIRFLVFAIGIFLTFSISLPLIQLGVAGMTLLAIAALCIWIFLFVVSRPLANAFPENCQTIADVVRHAKPPHYPPLHSTEFSHKSPDEIWQRVVRIIVAALSVDETDVRPETRFIEDLRVD